MFEGLLFLPSAPSWKKVARTVSTWADNRMSLNTTKTKSLLITTMQNCCTLTSALSVQISGRSIEQVDYAKMLGVMMDSAMSWMHHIDTICCIISSNLSLLHRFKPYLNFDSALRFYNSKLPSLFLSRLSSAKHLEDLLYSTCHNSIHFHPFP